MINRYWFLITLGKNDSLSALSLLPFQKEESGDSQYLNYMPNEPFPPKVMKTTIGTIY